MARKYRIQQKKRRDMAKPLFMAGSGVALILVTVMVIGLIRTHREPTFASPAAGKDRVQKEADHDKYSKDIAWAVSLYQTRKDFGGKRPPAPTADNFHGKPSDLAIYSAAWEKVWGKGSEEKPAVTASAPAPTTASVQAGPLDAALRQERYDEFLKFYTDLRKDYPNGKPQRPKDDNHDAALFELRLKAYHEVYGYDDAAPETK
jgi:hypothetical protein